MNDIGKPEYVTQERVIKLLVDDLGYRYLGDWTDRDGNSNVEDGILSGWLTEHGYTSEQIAFYKGCVALVRAYANISDELDRAGYSAGDIDRIKKQIDYYLNIREIIRKASGETLDLKPYEADMRHLIDTYIEADEPRKISFFDNMGLLELIVKTGIANAISAQLGGLKGDRNAISEVIENNVRRKIIKENLNDPAFYEKMSALLDEIIAARKPTVMGTSVRRTHKGIKLKLFGRCVIQE